MAQALSLILQQTIEREISHLRAVDEERARVPRGPGKWCPKEELGHLIDSATNNHVRFVSGAIQPEYCGPSYAQEEWVRLHGYCERPWDTIVNFWFQYNQLLSALVANIPEERLAVKCLIAQGPEVTLGFVIEDYILHMQHHIDQLLRRESVTKYPGAAIRATF
jgi:hypothetical protein